MKHLLRLAIYLVILTPVAMARLNAGSVDGVSGQGGAGELKGTRNIKIVQPPDKCFPLLDNAAPKDPQAQTPALGPEAAATPSSVAPSVTLSIGQWATLMSENLTSETVARFSGMGLNLADLKIIYEDVADRSFQKLDELSLLSKEALRVAILGKVGVMSRLSTKLL